MTRLFMLADLTPDQRAELERRYDGPIPQRAVDDYKAALKRREQLWEWHEDDDAKPAKKQVYVEPAGVWQEVPADD